MVCSIFNEQKELPSNKTGIVGEIFRLAMIRSNIKTLDSFTSDSFNESDGIKRMYILGKFSWEALKKDVKQTLLDKVRLCHI